MKLSQRISNSLFEKSLNPLSDKAVIRSLETSKSLLSKMEKEGHKWGWSKDKLEDEIKKYKQKIQDLLKEVKRRGL